MIEVVKISDINLIKQIIELFSEDFTPALIPRIGNLEEYTMKLFQLGNVYAARENNRYLGYISFYANDLKSGYAYISQLAVKKHDRNKGVGSLLINCCIQAVKNSGLNRIKLEVRRHNNNAIQFYKSFGFKYSEEADIDSVFMELSLE